MSSIYDLLIEVEIFNPENFLKIKETLSRIGIASKSTKTLYQTCHIFHRRNRYYIVHFLEMFLIDGKGRHFSEEDKARRNQIALLLEDWGLLKILNPEILSDSSGMKNICIIPFKEKQEWKLVQKYNIGK
jgi:hypothetical protein